MTIQQKMAYNIQLTNEECREMVEKILKTMTHIVLQHGSEMIDSKMRIVTGKQIGRAHV